MFTNNYIQFRKQAFLNSYGQPYTIPNGQVKSAYMNGSDYYDIGQWLNKGRCCEISSASYTASYPSGLNPGVYFGSGSTPATKADYTLESPIISGLTITNPSSLVWENDGNGKYTATADFILRNTTESEINIYEVGVFSAVNTNTSTVQSQWVWWLVLMERTVLIEPITIAPGEAKLVSYKMTFNQTLNVE